MKKMVTVLFVLTLFVSAFAGNVNEDKNKKAGRAKTEAAKKEIVKQPRKQLSPAAKKEASVMKYKSINN